MVPAVRDMGRCQASYAFSVASTIESLYRIAVDNQVQLSVEQIIQCSQSFSNNGCNGGSIFQTYSYIKQNKLCTDNQYPYSSFEGSTGNCNSALTALG